jgi:membrane-anchored protein YejM (alkaline phosphatase superfamily)
VKPTITNTVSFLKSHIVGIIIVGIFCSLTASFIYSWIPSPHASSKTSSTSAPSQPQFSPTISTTSAPSQPQFSPITLDEVLQASSDSSRTELQKEEFRRRYDGKVVEWQAQVGSVQRQGSRDDSDFLVVLRAPDTKSPGLGEFFAVSFSANSRDSMLDLHVDDTITVRGTLHFLNDLSHSPTLDKCEVIQRRTK